ncbi:MFS transporter [Leucobacter sp. gxy201]|uniref:CynX/NimT family MFS transporter n=1 Tax=Leucobacter sp. gxy201 TaxID=2957200 RepID=UPI003DA0FC35
MTSAARPAPSGGDAPLRMGFALAGVLLLAMNLRAGITSVGPVLGDIQHDLGISGSAASFLISLPVVGFAIFSPLAPLLARRIGLEWTLGGALLVLTGAIVLRSVPIPGAIWGGTALLGAAVATLNVLIPALVKREYPHRVGLMTGVYSAAQSTLAAVAAGLAVPIAGASQFGWRLSLGVWAGLGLIGFAVFLPTLRRRVRVPTGSPAAAAPAPRTGPPMWRSALAWQVTLFLGLQSTIYYTVITWWPTIERDLGYSSVAAGWHQFAFQCCGIIGSLSAAALLHRLPSQSAIAAAAAILPIIGLAGVLLMPQLALLWVALIGLSGGIAITTALSLFGLRTRDHHQAASLSGLAQSIGYLLAAAGPVAVGAMHDATGSWKPGLVLVLANACGMLVFGTLAGRDRFVGETGRPAQR